MRPGVHEFRLRQPPAYRCADLSREGGSVAPEAAPANVRGKRKGVNSDEPVFGGQYTEKLEASKSFSSVQVMT
jgi:hypothetical protein